jgi:acetylglutamate kinase
MHTNGSRYVKALIKLGGTLLDAPESCARLAREIAAAAREHEIAVVHGGGKQMTRFLGERGVESRFVNGLRVTTPEILDAVLKVFAGSVNTGLVAAFRAAGANPVGLTGLDGGVLDAAPLDSALGHVGKPAHSDARLIEVLIGAGYLPVIACVAGDARGAIYNVNGDQMAGACAVQWGARKLIFLTDVAGVRGADGGIAAALEANQALDLIRAGVASGGMQAKLEAAIAAVGGGVREVLIAPGGEAGVVARALGGEGVGTRIESAKVEAGQTR